MREHPAIIPRNFPHDSAKPPLPRQRGEDLLASFVDLGAEPSHPCSGEEVNDRQDAEVCRRVPGVEARVEAFVFMLEPMIQLRTDRSHARAKTRFVNSPATSVIRRERKGADGVQLGTFLQKCVERGSAAVCSILCFRGLVAPHHVVRFCKVAGLCEPHRRATLPPGSICEARRKIVLTLGRLRTSSGA